MTDLVGSDKRLEDTVEFGRVHVLLVFTLILDHLGESRISMVHVINQVFKLRSRPADKGPHLLAILVVELHIGKVLCEFLADGLQTFKFVFFLQSCETRALLTMEGNIRGAQGSHPSPLPDTTSEPSLFVAN